MKKCSVLDIENALNNAHCQIIDVREPAEHEAEHLSAAKLIPLSRFDAELPKSGLDKNKPVYVLCRSGNRAGQAAQKLMQAGFQEVRVLEGGLAAWSAAGKSTTKGVSRVWGLERQVRFAAGFLVLLGLMLAHWVNIYWVGLSVFVACGLMFSAVTDTCTMGLILAKMPWNQKNSKGCCAS